MTNIIRANSMTNIIRANSMTNIVGVNSMTNIVGLITTLKHFYIYKNYAINICCYTRILNTTLVGIRIDSLNIELVK